MDAALKYAPVSENTLDVQGFLSQCSSFLAADQILNATAAHAAYAANTTIFETTVKGALLPRNQDEIVRIVELANQHKVALYPISTGHNWGYGGASPQSEGAVIVDLHRMNKIISVDPELGVAVIEPGVTTGQLYIYLAEHNLPYIVPVTGAGPDNSLIGNALERGFGLPPISDHFQAIMSLTAVMGDGRIYRSALGENGVGDIDHLYKWGVGPYVDGLFAQGNFGIVTQAAIALAPKAERVEFFSLDFKGLYPDEAVNWMRSISQRYGGNLSKLSLVNKTRLISSSPLDAPETAPDWKLFGAIYGDRRVVGAIKQELRRYRGRSVIRRRFLDLQRLRKLAKLLLKLPASVMPKRLRANLEYLMVFSDFMSGKPTDMFVNHVIYAGKGTGSLNPDRDGKGFMWYAPLIPMRTDDVRGFLDMVAPILANYGFDFSISLIGFSWHCLDGTLLLKYDHNDPTACARAQECYETLFSEGLRQGFVPYRVGVQGMRLLVDQQKTFWQVTSAIKKALDPNAILSPGRYNLHP